MPWEVRDGAVHGEDAVGRDEAKTRVFGGLELGFQVGHVAVFVAVAMRLTKPHAVDDAGVVQLIGNDRVFRA